MLFPLSLEVFIQPEGIVPESAVLVRPFSLVFSYFSTQRCGAVCECQESLLGHPFSYETWWNRARALLQVCLGAYFQPIIWSFRGGQKEDPHDWFMQAIATDRAPFSNGFTGSMNFDTK